MCSRASSTHTVLPPPPPLLLPPLLLLLLPVRLLKMPLALLLRPLLLLASSLKCSFCCRLGSCVVWSHLWDSTCRGAGGRASLGEAGLMWHRSD